MDASKFHIILQLSLTNCFCYFSIHTLQLSLTNFFWVCRAMPTSSGKPSVWHFNLYNRFTGAHYMRSVFMQMFRCHYICFYRISKGISQFLIQILFQLWSNSGMSNVKYHFQISRKKWYIFSDHNFNDICSSRHKSVQNHTFKDSWLAYVSTCYVKIFID